ncbi:MAG TPA: hypothetical protein V6D15_07720 [Oculatellaceae cyanobacterium]
MKKLPWASLALLLLTYITFGWLLYAWNLSWRVWLLTAFFVVVISLALTFPIRSIQIFFAGALKTDTRALIFILALSFFAVALLTWFQTFVRVLVLLSSGLLARLDLHNADFKVIPTFVIMAITSLVGLGLGLLIHHWLILHPLF